jgi:hypothetical protein
MSHLIPQLRADKTGKMVTRHVRAEPKATSGRSSIPKPTLAATKHPAASAPDPMDQPFSLGPFNWRGNDPVIDALHRKFDIDESQTMELTSKQWLAARRTGVFDRQIHAFLLAGITEPEDMLEFAIPYQKALSPNVKPGLHRKREQWVDSLLEAGITREQFITADRNFGSYSILNVLDSFDYKGSPADAVRMYAEYSNKQTQQALNNFLYDGSLTLDQLKEIGVSRVRKYSSNLSEFLRQDETYGVSVSLTDIAQVIKAEERSSAAINPNAASRITFRLGAVRRWGMERGMELREPFLLGMYSGEMNGMSDDESFAFAKHHDDVIHLSILRGTHSNKTRAMKKADFSKSKEYSHLSASEFYFPQAAEVLEYFNVGLTPEETIDALENGVDPIAARGVKEGATPAVASGWL